jgi:hypothetical protein
MGGHESIDPIGGHNEPIRTGYRLAETDGRRRVSVVRQRVGRPSQLMLETHSIWRCPDRVCARPATIIDLCDAAAFIDMHGDRTRRSVAAGTAVRRADRNRS